MIKATELRVGNKVLYKPYDNPSAEQITVTISWISDNQAGYYEQHEASYPHSEKEYSPIPLTDDVVEKCGFEFDEVVDSDGDEISFIAIRKPNGKRFYLNRAYQPEDCGFPILDYKLQYLHQLQNLYFALTGEELNVSL